MVTYKDSEAKLSQAKRNITIKNVRIEGSELYDEKGNIIPALMDVLPEDVEEFTIKISLALPEEI